jgi:hypothetical protein
LPPKKIIGVAVEEEEEAEEEWAAEEVAASEDPEVETEVGFLLST